VKMSYQGAHGQGGQLNPEITFGVDFEDVRFTMKYEWYSSIQYRKWTVFAGDYKPKLFNNESIETFIGFEVNLFYLYDPVPEIYNDNLSAGTNAEIVYWFTDHIGVNANTNFFTAEARDNFGNEMKKYRWDVRLGLIFKL
ncbi:MAG: hypothetical protein HRT88_18370, partial [Lentisphaeraceae bacterium]|nr:hypothetical protein [Lentisphaeraceae bacterium]